MKLASPKRFYCAYCGKIILRIGITWQDEDGRSFRFHKKCDRDARTDREKEKALYPIRG